MENICTSTKLPYEVHKELVLKGIRIQSSLKKDGFIMEGSRPIHYGFQIKFRIDGQYGCFKVFKNKRNFTTYDYSGVLRWSIIMRIKSLIAQNQLFDQPARVTIPTYKKRRTSYFQYKKRVEAANPPKSLKQMPLKLETKVSSGFLSLAKVQASIPF